MKSPGDEQATSIGERERKYTVPYAEYAGYAGLAGWLRALVASIKQLTALY